MPANGSVSQSMNKMVDVSPPEDAPCALPVEFLASAAGDGSALLAPLRTPVIEPGFARFVWQGEADTVWLRLFMSLSPSSFPLAQVPGSDLWTLTLKVPDRARFEYKFDVVRGGHGHWINDPLNPDHATDPFGANSVCMTHGYVAPEWAVPDTKITGGEVENFVLEETAFGDPRELAAYLPVGYDEAKQYPLVVIHDGWDYIDHAALIPTLDNLIARGDLPPLIAALTQSPKRNVEYVDDPRHTDFIVEDLLPAFEARYNIDPRPRHRVIMGASLGAVASLSVAARAPRVFGGGVLKSGSFIFDAKLLETRSALFGQINGFIDSLSIGERHLRRAFVTCGRFEGLVTQNRRMGAYLRRSGIDTRYTEGRDAHHWQNWRDQTRAGLMWCLRETNITGE